MKTVKINGVTYEIIAKYQRQCAARRRSKDENGFYMKNPKGRGWLVAVPRINGLPV